MMGSTAMTAEPEHIQHDWVESVPEFTGSTVKTFHCACGAIKTKYDTYISIEYPKESKKYSYIIPDAQK